jgi:hypothetical protein
MSGDARHAMTAQQAQIWLRDSNRGLPRNQGVRGSHPSEVELRTLEIGYLRAYQGLHVATLATTSSEELFVRLFETLAWLDQVPRSFCF